MLYDRDQAFGGSQLTQLIARQYGFSFEEAESKEAATATCPTTTTSAILGPFVDSLSQEIGRALQYFFTSTPHHKVHYVMLAGGTATLPGLKDRVTELRPGFASQVVNPFESMKLGLGGARKQAAPRSPVLPHGLRAGHAEVPAVILINLLPHREAAPQAQRKRAFFAALVRSAPSPASCSSAAWYLGAAAADVRRSRTATLPHGRDQAARTCRSRTSPTLRAEIEALKARQQAVEDLQTDRNMPVHLLNELVQQTPEGVYLTSRQAGRPDGRASPASPRPTSGSPSSCATLLYNSPWLEQALNWSRSRPATRRRSRRDRSDQRRLSNSRCAVTLKRPPRTPLPRGIRRRPPPAPARAPAEGSDDHGLP